MTVLVSIWLGVGVVVAIAAKKVGPWRRAIPGAFIWPTYPFLIAGSWLRYKHLRRSLSR